MAKGVKAVFEFKTDEARKAFLVWLCESGEQEYWMWMEAREQESAKTKTVLDFNYGNLHKKSKDDMIVQCKEGRLDD